MNMLSVEPFLKFTICSCAWNFFLCLTTSKIVFDNKQIIWSKNCVWRQTKLYLTTSKLHCQKSVFDDKKINCIWKQANCIVKKLCLMSQKKLYLKTRKLYLTTNKIVFDNKQIVLSKNCVWQPKKKIVFENKKIVFDNKQNCIWQQTNCIVVSSPLIPKGVWNLKHPQWTFGGCQWVSVWPPHFVIRLDYCCRQKKLIFSK